MSNTPHILFVRLGLCHSDSQAEIKHGHVGVKCMVRFVNVLSHLHITSVIQKLALLQMYVISIVQNVLAAHWLVKHINIKI
jgi:hypothetical protein